MKKIKRILAIAVITGVMFSSSPSAAGAANFTMPGFSDVSDLYRDAVEYSWCHNIARGISEKQFGIAQPLKRVDGAIMIARSIDMDIEATWETPFMDLPERAISAVSALYEAKIMNGKTATSFAPNETMTRGEIALILSKAYNLPPTTEKSTFTDVTERYEDAVNRLVASGIIRGKSPTRFGVQDPLTRGELVIMLYKAEPLFKQKSPYGELPSSNGGLTLQLDKTSYSESEEKMALTVKNTSRLTYHFDYHFSLEVKGEDSWYKVPFNKDIVPPAVMNEIRPAESYEQMVYGYIYKLKFKEGEYRLIQNFWQEDGTEIILAIPFEITG
ncbi:S-layer homology domain-containing protein [Bacillus sp. B190/17]|uniref:S-layer homology domain-containing protein n=1 Tax=Bacillus lumedeiriae TaxID=3058829 RepID=A0ABW8IBZ4_9BACI